MSETNSEKQEARSHIRARLSRVGAGELRDWSSAICKHLIEWAPASEAVCPMVYLPTPEEAGVDCYTAWRISRGLTVCGPRVDWETRDLTPKAIEDMENGIEIRRHAIREPVAGAETIRAGRIDLVLTPGLAFDESGRRVGRGAGCYDRFFARNDLMEGIFRVGVCFEAQLIPVVPMDAHDMSVGVIITERRIIEPMKR